MGALHGAITVRRYVVRGEKPKEPARIVKGAKAHVLIPIDPKSDAEKVCGWASLHDPTDLELEADKMFHGPAVGLALRVNSLVPPASVVKRMVAERLRATGRKPNLAEKKAAKEEVKKSLRGKVLPTMRAYDVVWQSDTDTVHVWSHAKNVNEMVVNLFYKSFGLELVPRGPTIVAGRGAIPRDLQATPEMVLGFAGLPGRTLEEDGAGDDSTEENADG